LVFGIGTDLIEVERVQKFVSKGEVYLASIFTRNEMIYCQSKHFPSQHFAARFAAKEAFLKAMGTGWQNGTRFTDIEIQNDDSGKPHLSVTGDTKTILDNLVTSAFDTQVSMSHLKSYATATVIIETRE